MHKEFLERERSPLVLLLHYPRSFKTSVRKVCLLSVIDFKRLIFKVHFHREPLFIGIIFQLVKIRVSMILYHPHCEYGIDLLVVLREIIDFVDN